jgi:hypothetical protein
MWSLHLSSQLLGKRRKKDRDLSKKKKINKIISNNKLGMVAQVCNANYEGGRGRRNHTPRPMQWESVTHCSKYG